MPSCTKCPYLLWKGDTHSECSSHSKCFNGTVLDPRSCEECTVLFQRAEAADNEAITCWGARLRALEALVGEDALHPEAKDWILPQTSNKDVHRKEFNQSSENRLMAMMDKMFEEIRSSNNRIQALESRTRQSETSEDGSDHYSEQEENSDQSDMEQEEELPSMIGESFSLPSQVPVFPDSIELPNSTITIGE